MKNFPATKNILDTAHDLTILPYLKAEWEMNRYCNTKVYLGDLSEPQFDEELFPLSSVALPNRPRKGISKAIAGQGYLEEEEATPNRVRYYLPSASDNFKLWVSDRRSNASGDFPDLPAGANEVHVKYVEEDGETQASVRANKIVVALDNGWATPTVHSISVRYNGSTIRTVVNPPVEDDGTVTLYWQQSGGGQWTLTPQPVPKVSGLQYVNVEEISYSVSKLGPGRNSDGTISQYRNASGGMSNTTGGNSRISIISIGALMQVDLTEQLISFSDNAELSEDSEYYPLGTVTSNSGDLVLSNLYVNGSGEMVPGLFAKSNVSSPLSGFSEPNAKFTMSYISGSDTIPQFEMYSDEWSAVSEAEIQVPLKDSTKFLNEVTPEATLFEGLTAYECVQRLLDSVGFTKWRRKNPDLGQDTVIPLFWTDGEKNVWEVIDEIARATQTAFYVNSEGWLVMATRDEALNPANTPVMTLRTQTSGANLSNVISLSQPTSEAPNKMVIEYKEMDWEKHYWTNKYTPKRDVWVPPSTLALRSTTLKRDLSKSTSANNNKIYLGPTDVKTWPFTGMVEIEGETIKYEGKEVRAYRRDGTSYTTVCKSSEEFQALKKAAGKNRDKVIETGNLIIPVENGSTKAARGLMSSIPDDHFVETNKGWNYTTFQNNATVGISAGVGDYLRESVNSCIRLKSPNGANAWTTAHVNLPGTDQWDRYGTRFRFTNKKGHAGLILHMNGKTCYMLTVGYMSDAEDGLKARFMKWNGSKLKVLKEGNATAGMKAWTSLDMNIRQQGDNYVVTAFVNGKVLIRRAVFSGDDKTAFGRAGVVAANGANAQFDYFYALRKGGERDLDDESSFFDLINGSYTSNRLNTHFFWRKRTLPKGKKKNAVAFFDDFGPYVHEVREMEVAYSEAPVRGAAPFLSNNHGVECPEFLSTPFGAKFTLVNTGRTTAILSGEDSTTGVTSVFNISGNVLNEGKSGDVTVENTRGIRKAGVLEAKMESTYIQSEEEAKKIGDWMNNHWGTANDKLEVSIFGNPLIELGDVVQVVSPYHHINDRYFVLAISNAFSDGVTTSLRLRRVPTV